MEVSVGNGRKYVSAREGGSGWIQNDRWASGGWMENDNARQQGRVRVRVKRGTTS